jgi:tetratricopeptide (TPR) repeat protein
LTESIRLNPQSHNAYNNRALAYKAKGELESALADYEEALRLKPDFALAYTNRGLLFANKGEYERAIADYLAAIQVKPDYANAFNNLAWLWATCPNSEVRQGARAVEYATKACDLSDWNNPNCMETLAAAYAEIGDFAKAIQWQQKALESPDYRKDHGDKGQDLIRLFEAGKPYRTGE